MDEKQSMPKTAGRRSAVGDSCGALENVWPELFARDETVSSLLDLDCALRSNASKPSRFALEPCEPLPNHARANAYAATEFMLREFVVSDVCSEVHGTHYSFAIPCVNSFATNS